MCIVPVSNLGCNTSLQTFKTKTKKKKADDVSLTRGCALLTAENWIHVLACVYTAAWWRHDEPHPARRAAWQHERGSACGREGERAGRAAAAAERANGEPWTWKPAETAATWTTPTGVSDVPTSRARTVLSRGKVLSHPHFCSVTKVSEPS